MAAVPGPVAGFTAVASCPTPCGGGGGVGAATVPGPDAGFTAVAACSTPKKAPTVVAAPPPPVVAAPRPAPLPEARLNKVALLVPLWFGRRLGGHSGDTYGACVEWSETLALLLSGLGLRLAG